MNFLVWWNPLTWLSDAVSSIAGSILKALRTAFFALDTIIYKLIIDLYDMFMSLCSVRILSNDLLHSISERIGLILGIIMLFVITFSFIEMLLNPDNVSDKEKGAVAIIKKTLIVIVMLGVSNFVFDGLFYIQKTVVQSNVISKLLLPYTISVDTVGNGTSAGQAVMDNDKFGSLLSEELLMSFYKLEQFDADAEMDTDNENTYLSCSATVNAFRTQIVNYKRFDLGYNCLNENITVSFKIDGSSNSQPQETTVINFNWLLSAACGIAVAYLIFMYCFKVGVRMVQLMFLEVISPMAFVSYLSPKKDTMFSKWKKIYISTYIDVFIRIAIINFVFFLIAVVLSTTSSEDGLEFWNSLNPANGVEVSFYTVVIILALLTFAKKAPDLLKELIPASASKLGFGASMKDIVGLQKGIGTIAGIGTGAAIGLLGGAVGGARAGYERNGLLSGIGHGFTGALGGVAGGLFRGGHAGFGAKGLGSAMQTARKNQSQANKRSADLVANGGTWFGSRVASLQGTVGMRNAHDVDENQIASAQKIIDMYNEASKEAEGEAIKYGGNYKMLSYDGSRRTLTELEMLKNDQTKSATDRAKYDKEYRDLLKAATMFNLDYGAAMENSEANFDGNGKFDYVRTTSGRTYNATNIDGMSADDRKILIGNSNAKIEVNMSNLVGTSKSGRGNAGKTKRNSNSTFIVNKKGSASYERNKTNAGKQ